MVLGFLHRKTTLYWAPLEVACFYSLPYPHSVLFSFPFQFSVLLVLRERGPGPRLGRRAGQLRSFTPQRARTVFAPTLCYGKIDTPNQKREENRSHLPLTAIRITPGSLRN